MFPINSNQSNRPFLASNSPNLLTTPARTDLTHEAYDAEVQSVTQISTGLVSIPVSGSNHQVEVHYHGTGLDSKLLETLIRQQNFALQPNTAPLANLGESIETMRKNYLSVLQVDETIRDALSLYVAPEGKAVGSGESGERFDLRHKLNAFLESDKKVFLLLGEAGSGKSTFNRYLARDLWKKCEQADRNEDESIPVFIQLTTLKDPNENLLTEYFTEEGFSKEQIQQLRQNHRFIFILDGYDEIKYRHSAFYTNNKLDKWDAKVIISSRPEYLGPSYQSKFYPAGQARAFEECELAPFSKTAIGGYVENYFSHAKPKWNVAQYQSALSHSDLQALIGNPFLLKIVLEVLPSLSSKEGSSNRNSYTRTALYEQFAKNWFGRSQSRLQGIRLTEKERETFDRLAEEGFIQHGIHFSQEFALALYKKQAQVATYSAGKANEAQEWGRFLSNADEKTRLLRFNAPLSRQGGQYRFIHKSVRDYFVARALWEELAAGDKIEVFSWFNRLNIVNDPAILQFLAERVRQEPQLETRLLSVVEQSKGKGGIQFERGAANALTALIKAGVQLINKNFSGIRVCGADLSYGVFDHTKFEGADLRRVNWSGAWLRGVNLNEADLAELELGERPSLKVKKSLFACSYSLDGQWLAVAEKYNVNLYETKNLRKVHTYAGHKNEVRSAVFSTDGKWLVSGSYDNTVKLWGVLGERPLMRTYIGHEKAVMSVALSADGKWLASGSQDCTLKLWSILGACSPVHTYTGHEEMVASVAFSSDGWWLASGSSDSTIKLWNLLGDYALVHTYEGHENGVSSVAFSPDGQWLASASWDHTVRLWSILGDRNLVHTYGHRDGVLSVAFSRDEQWLASGSWDGIVRLWSILGDRSLTQTYVGHRNRVKGVVFSPDSQWLVSGSEDKTVRLWSVSGNRALARAHNGHRDKVKDLAFSPDGKWLASRSWEGALKLWNILGDCSLTHTYVEPWGNVMGIAFSPDGGWLAAAGDENGTVKLWSSLGVQYLARTHEIYRPTIITSIAFSADGQWLAFGYKNSTVELWNISSGCRLMHTYEDEGEDGDEVRSIAFSTNGKWLAFASYHSPVKLWNITGNYSLEHEYSEPGEGVLSVQFSYDSRCLVSGSWDNAVRLWSTLGDRSLLYTYIGHLSEIHSVAFSFDGQWLASGSTDGTVRIWSVYSGACQATLRDFVGWVESVAWRPSSVGATMLATGGRDKVIRLWRIPDNLGQGGQITLEWTSQQETLTAGGALIKNAYNLSPQNTVLLRQRGAEWTEGGESATAFFEEDSDELFSESDELSEVSSESEGSDFAESVTNRYSENLSQSPLNLANVSIQESVDLNAEDINRIQSEFLADLEPGRQLDFFNGLIESESLLSLTEFDEMFWPEGEMVEEGITDAELLSKKRTHSTSSISLEINRKKGKGDDSFL
ncbi:MAG: WD40 repeat [Glomeribacter sp. 1016415]|nr:WD40 repeat [Glomeribacter sp. 1016415]